jgi:RNA recognition motif-containing protein
VRGSCERSEKKGIISPVLFFFSTPNSGDEELLSHCGALGLAPKSAQVMKNPSNGRSKGWGLITFAGAADADLARVKLDGSVLDDRTLYARFNDSSKK